MDFRVYNNWPTTVTPPVMRLNYGLISTNKPSSDLLYVSSAIIQVQLQNTKLATVTTGVTQSWALRVFHCSTVTHYTIKTSCHPYSFLSTVKGDRETNIVTVPSGPLLLIQPNVLCSTEQLHRFALVLTACLFIYIAVWVHRSSGCVTYEILSIQLSGEMCLTQAQILWAFKLNLNQHILSLIVCTLQQAWISMPVLNALAGRWRVINVQFLTVIYIMFTASTYQVPHWKAEHRRPSALFIMISWLFGKSFADILASADESRHRSQNVD